MISVIIESDDKLTRQTWGFYFDEHRMRLSLSQYFLEQRKTTRHKYKIVREYDCHDSRGRGYYYSIEKEDVPWSEDIVNAARQQVIDRLTVEK